MKPRRLSQLNVFGKLLEPCIREWFKQRERKVSVYVLMHLTAQGECCGQEQNRKLGRPRSSHPSISWLR